MGDGASRRRKAIRAAALAVLVAAAPAHVRASSDSGLYVSVGKLTLRVTYVDVLDYGDGADRAIGDPRRALFTLLTLLQANAAAAARTDAMFWVDVHQGRDGVTSELQAWYDVPSTGAHVDLRDGPAPADVEREIVRVFCGAFPQACAVPPKPALELWACRDREVCPGRVTFGALPSSDGRALAILAPPRARAKRLVVERPSMIRWFDVLE